MLPEQRDGEERGVAFASFKGHECPLRHHPTVASCHFGGHAIGWTVDTVSEEDALRLPP